MTARTRGGTYHRFAPTALAVVLAAGAACRSALSTVLDLPPPTSPQPAAVPAAPAAPSQVSVDTARPPIERIRDADSVRRLLPRDRAGNIDWVAALRRGIINPRGTLPTRTVPPPGGFQFAFDFVFRGPDTTFDAQFPHSVHTEWLGCPQCHPRIFPYRNTPMKMGEILQGKYCAECHGKVAFPISTGCERCHQRLSMPPDRAQPDLLGTLTLARVQDDSGSGRALNAAALPPAAFPHWIHRIRFQCKVCHMDLFEPKGGANVITMQMMRAGKACGQCHNGVVAFAPTVSNCQQCHVSPSSRSGP